MGAICPGREADDLTGAGRGDAVGRTHLQLAGHHQQPLLDVFVVVGAERLARGQLEQPHRQLLTTHRFAKGDLGASVSLGITVVEAIGEISVKRIRSCHSTIIPSDDKRDTDLAS